MYLEEASSSLPNPEDLEASGLWNRVHSWAFLPSSLGSPLGKMACHAGPANLFGTSPPGHSAGCGGRSRTLERGARPASGLGVLHLTHWESGVSLPPVQPRAEASQRCEPRSLPPRAAGVRARSSCCSCCCWRPRGARGARRRGLGDEDGEKKRRSERGGSAGGGRGGSAAWRCARGAWTSGGGGRRPDAVNLPRPSAHRRGERVPSAAGGGRLARGLPGGGGRPCIINELLPNKPRAAR